MSENTLPRAAHPEIAALLDELAASGRPSSRTLPLPDGRRNFAELFEPFTAYPEVGAVEDRVIPVDGRVVPVRVYRPEEPARAGASVFLHGGGWVFGDLRSHDGMCRSLTRRSGITTVAVDYRRAPEHPFPAAVEDAAGVVRWLAARGGEIGVAGPLAVVGDSSGANLAAAASLVLRDEGDSPVAFQALLYPATDPAMSTESYRENADDPFLSRDEMVWYWSQYGGGTVPGDPRAALSAVADLRGFPPTYVLVAGLDPLRDEGLALAAALRQAGVPVRCSEYPDMPHGFLLFAGRLSRAVQALSEVADEVAAGLGGR
ncbi:MAG TPA: alpha/beta hydrolase [Streptosporangiaceae bacterium]|jgi:acetyl esterase|nr:alpha/beta hydrolase [Streptosporangiaceae bacterium]